MNESMPLAYFLTWTCYGTWLHGDERGSVNDSNNQPGRPGLPANKVWVKDAADRMVQTTYSLDPQRRRIVLKAICEVCAFRQWLLHAAHVRSNHVHTVITSSLSPERIMNDLKAYASKRLNQAGFDTKDRKRWTRHGSTRYLWNEDRLAETIEYVLRGQGSPMEVFTRTE